MNLILFEAHEIDRLLPLNDPRARHLLEVLQRKPGDWFDAGIVNHSRGRARVVTVDAAGYVFLYEPGLALPPLPPTELLIGLPRPQTARDILRDATTLGATRLSFLHTRRSDPNYARSSLWQEAEWRRHVLAGAAQAFDPRVPEVRWGSSLAAAAAAAQPVEIRIALDNYEPEGALAEMRGLSPAQSVVIAIGPERGWDADDREQLRRHGFTLAHLGPRVLRTETAVVAALTLLTAVRGRV